MITRRALSCFIVFAFACSPPDPDATTRLAAPDPATFKPLQQAMGAGCASLDCHGQAGRNLRIYDARGLRLAPKDVAGIGGTTDDENLADLRSLMGLEPEITSQVLKEKGQQPDRLMVVRKARSTVEHKGGIVWPAGSHGDKCLTSFFASNTNVEACACAAAEFSAAGPDPMTCAP